MYIIQKQKQKKLIQEETENLKTITIKKKQQKHLKMVKKQNKKNPLLSTTPSG